MRRDVLKSHWRQPLTQALPALRVLKFPEELCLRSLARRIWQVLATARRIGAARRRRGGGRCGEDSGRSLVARSRQVAHA